MGPYSTKDEHKDTELQASGSPASTRGKHEPDKSQRPKDTSKSSAIDLHSASATAINRDHHSQHRCSESFGRDIESSAIRSAVSDSTPL